MDSDAGSVGYGDDFSARTIGPTISDSLHPSFAETLAVKILVTEQQIQDSINKVAEEIRARESGKPLTVIAIMTGSIVFLADLMRKLDQPIRVGVVQTSSYKGGTKRGALTINSDMMLDVEGRDVLLVDDIFDTGHTLDKVIEMIDELGPKSVKSAVLLLKRGRQEVKMRPDYVGFEIPDEFVVGYGLDYRDMYRNLPYLAALEESDLVDHK
jgi:hypoxanthine phosphoribosyltransferase